MNRFFLFSLLAFALAACQTPETAESTATPMRTVADTESDRATIEALTVDYGAAARAGDADAIAALYADDAIIHPANEPSVQGRADLDAYFATAYAEPVDFTFSTADVVVAESGDMAYEVGTYADGQSKYLTVYRKMDGRWLIVGDSWSNGAPPTATN